MVDSQSQSPVNIELPSSESGSNGSTTPAESLNNSSSPNESLSPTHSTNSNTSYTTPASSIIDESSESNITPKTTSPENITVTINDQKVQEPKPSTTTAEAVGVNGGQVAPMPLPSYIETVPISSYTSSDEEEVNFLFIHSF